MNCTEPNEKQPVLDQFALVFMSTFFAVNLYDLAQIIKKFY